MGSSRPPSSSLAGLSGLRASADQTLLGVSASTRQSKPSGEQRELQRLPACNRNHCYYYSYMVQGTLTLCAVGSSRPPSSSLAGLSGLRASADLLIISSSGSSTADKTPEIPSSPKTPPAASAAAEVALEVCCCCCCGALRCMLPS